MAWPKGLSRKDRLAEIEAARATEALKGPHVIQERADRPPIPRPLMKAKPNWESYDPSAESEDRLHIDPSKIPAGYDLQWITSTVLGQEFGQLRSRFERSGWTPVHQQDFNGIFDGLFMSAGAQGEINVDGLVLMARPMEFTIRARREEQRKAREVVQIKQQQLTGGDIPGVTLDTRHSSALSTNRINRTIESVEIPRDGESH